MAQLQRPYRHELKFYINEGEARLLQTRLELTMDHDENAGEYGDYFIRSLYLDDMVSSGYRTKEDGLNERRKYRIRTYNFSDEVIKLECKEKYGSYIRKTSLDITRDDCDRILTGDGSRLLQYGSSLGNMLYIRMQSQLMRPVVIVDYTREAFIAPTEDVRITFDRDLKTGVYSTDLFDRELPTYPALRDYELILEVKFNDYLPLYYRDILNTGGVNLRSSASKYCLARQFE